jgi:hypothetical protein
MSASVVFGAAALICSGVMAFWLKKLIFCAPDKLSQLSGSVWPENVLPPQTLPPAAYLLTTPPLAIYFLATMPYFIAKAGELCKNSSKPCIGPS